MITLVELRECLKQVDETSLLEILDIHSDELVERFADFIENKYEELAPEFEIEETESDSD